MIKYMKFTHCVINVRKKKFEVRAYTEMGGTLKNYFGELGKDGRGIGREDHFLPHKFLKRTFQRQANSTKQLL